MTKPTCSIEDCENKVVARGWCDKHYRRWKKYGDPSKLSRYETPEAALQGRTEWQGDCLVWTGETRRGYGRIWSSGIQHSAHRWVWEQAKGPIPDGKVLDHICHNKPCVNIEHLRLASIQQNNSHLKGPSRHNKLSGVRNVRRSPDHRWQVVIQKDRKIHSFGVYDTIEAAAAVAERERKRLFGEFAGKG